MIRNRAVCVHFVPGLSKIFRISAMRIFINTGGIMHWILANKKSIQFDSIIDYNIELIKMMQKSTIPR